MKKAARSLEAERFFQKAEELTAQGDTRRALLVLLDALRHDPLHEPALTAVAEVTGKLGDSGTRDLFLAAASDPESPERLYDLGYHLAGEGRADVARSFLRACLERSPDNHDVRYELAYTLFLTRAYEEAIEHLEAAIDHLPPERGTAAELLCIECLIYAGKLEQAESLMERYDHELRLHDRGDVLDALELMACRLHSLGDEPPQSLRPWLFVQHGAALLAESRQEVSRGRFSSLVMNPAAVGAVLRLLRTFTTELDLGIEAILSLEGDSLPLALAAGAILQKPVRPMAQRCGEKELLVIHELSALQNLEKEVFARDSVEFLFCFRLDANRGAPILPDVAGIVAQSFRLPWQDRVEVASSPGNKPRGRRIPPDERSASDIAREIVELGLRLPEDPNMAGVMRFFRRHRDLLVVADAERFPWRRAWTTFSPL